MDKNDIRKKILLAIEADPVKRDIKKASVFGSYAYGTPKADSDVDILIEFKPSAKVGLFEFVRIQKRMSDLIGKRVDLSTPAGLSKFFRDEVLKEAETVYENW